MATHKPQDKSVLLVDDDANIRSLLQQELTEAGYSVRLAEDGRQALTLIREETPGLVILDVMMPEMNGFYVAAVMENDPPPWTFPSSSCPSLRIRSAASAWASTAISPSPSIRLHCFTKVDVLMDQGKSKTVNDCAADPRALASKRAPGSLICAPLRAGQRTVGLIALANGPEASYSAANLKLLNTIALQTAAAIRNSLLCTEMLGAVRDREQLAALQKELDTARTIQPLLVPRTFPPFPERTDFDLYAQMTSARAVGGDFFDFFLIDEDRLGVVIGDVSGKGIPAALYMAVSRTQVKTTVLKGMPPAECLQEANRVLVKEKVNAMFATCFYGLLNTRTGELQYCSAGHNPPYLLRAESGGVEVLAEVGGMPLGLFDGMGYTGSWVQLKPGDALFLYTDGVPEATNADDSDFTDERLTGTLRNSAALNCRDMISVPIGDGGNPSPSGEARLV